MKITLTGSLGRISKPLAKELLQQGHELTIISSKPEKQKEIEMSGAKAAIGSLEDAAFLSNAFTGADAVYCMEPPPDFSDHSLDLVSYCEALAHNFAEAIQHAGVKQVVHLSSIGAHTNKGNGMLALHYNAEQIMQQLPADVNIVFMRPVGFYYNMFAFIPTIKAAGAIVSNYGHLTEPWVSPLDIASAIAEEIAHPFKGRKVRYVASEELSCDEVAHTLGTAIGKPDLKWIVIPDEEMAGNMIKAGISPSIAKGLTEMNAGRRSGVLYEDYNKNKPVLGKTKLSTFAKEFAAVFAQTSTHEQTH